MKIVLLSVGKQHDPIFAQGIEAFSGRLKHYFPIEWLLIAPPKNAGQLSQEALIEAESALVLAQISTPDFVVLLDENGQQISSPQLAEKLNQWQVAGLKRLVFVVGGAFGAGAALKQRANFVWSLGKLVFPHMLVRLILAEQLYRAGTILRNEKYHHA